jgi:hypothetical protein
MALYAEVEEEEEKEKEKEEEAAEMKKLKGIALAGLKDKKAEVSAWDLAAAIADLVYSGALHTLSPTAVCKVHPIHTYEFMYTYANTHTDAYTRTHIYIYTCTHARIHALTYTHTHTHLQVLEGKFKTVLEHKMWSTHI